MKYQTELFDLISKDEEFTEIFQSLNAERLPQAMVCGGAIRDFIWNKQSKLASTLRFGNIDVFYCDPSESNEQALIRQTRINQKYSKYLWVLTNLALPQRHTSKLILQSDLTATLQNFPETCSAVAVGCDQAQNFSVLAPYGLDDLFEFRVKATPKMLTEKGRLDYQKRLQRKNWSKRWPNLQIIE